MLSICIEIFIVLSIASVIKYKFGFKQENAILTSFLGMLLFTYIAGLFNLMIYAVYIIIIIAVISCGYTIYNIVKKRIKISEIFTINVIAYIIAIIGVSLFVMNSLYIQWDEYSHWGTNLKAMLAYNVFWSNNVFDGIHVVYPPLAGIAEYITCVLNGGFAQDVTYMSVNMFIITLLIPFLSNNDKSIKNILKIVFLFLISLILIIVFQFSLMSIYIDLLLGVLFATGIFLAYRQDGKEDKINLIFVLISLALLKDTGIILGGIIIVQLFISEVIIKVIKQKKFTKEILKSILVIFAILVVILLFYGAWKLYCSINDRVLDQKHDNNYIERFDFNEYCKAIFNSSSSEKCNQIARDFFDRFLKEGMIGSKDVIFNRPIGIWIIINALLILSYFENDDEKTKPNILAMIVSFNIGTILYCLMLLATYMYGFTDQEGLRLACYERYLSTFYIAWFIAIVGIIISNKKQYIWMYIVILILLISQTEIDSYIALYNRRKSTTRLSQEVVMEHAKTITDNVSTDKKVCLVEQNDIKEEFHALRFHISPIVTNLLTEWSLETSSSNNISKEDYEKYLIDEKFDYIFFIKIDNSFITQYGDLFRDKIELENDTLLNGHLYKINKLSDSDVQFELYK